MILLMESILTKNDHRATRESGSEKLFWCTVFLRFGFAFGLH